jgi:CBS-domain-containing membrane protein
MAETHCSERECFSQFADCLATTNREYALGWKPAGPDSRFRGFFRNALMGRITFGSERSSKLIIMKNTSPLNQAEASAPRTLKDLVQRTAKALSPETSVQEACDQLRSEKITSSPVTDQKGQLIGTVSQSELNRKVGGFGHDPKIELTQTGLNQETVYCFEDETLAEAQRLMQVNNLIQLPVLTREKRMLGMVTLADVAREQKR